MRGKQSILQRIKNSIDFTALLEAAIKEHSNIAGGTHGIKNVSSALHRFDSILEPMGRLVLLLDPIISVAYRIAVLRAGKQEAKDAIEFLGYIAGTDGSERLLMLAGCADAGDMAMRLLRFFDTEQFDPAAMTWNIQQFLNKIDWAFNVGNIASHDQAFTCIMKQSLVRTRTLVIQGRTLCIGGPVTEATISKVLNRLRAWVVLATAAVKAEFPEWEILQAFAALRLDATPGVPDQSSVDRHLSRLSITFKVNCGALKTQYAALIQEARKYKQRTSGVSNLDAWKSVLHAAGGKKQLPELTAVLCRYAAYTGCTTSGVEQGHSTQDWLWPKRRSCLKTAREMMKSRWFKIVNQMMSTSTLKLLLNFGGFFMGVCGLAKGNVRMQGHNGAQRSFAETH